ncbi:uncharacterized protein TA02715 [Theileria annulata]|uniref:Uncharacterized protein n=1 Tax=Theileria annulata TaxID=5874 RepID=Q4UD46_THEAN|nr:uncharacterized protein TA02715 [Theileria annulata]CAI75255.1 hypothetical protein TA02715 [Theileria annulata]|eukprot:XP_954731.1 hypothetical protein TA02715 [Theileria annulata]
MNKLWVALTLVLVFAVALTIALTLTFVYKGRKKEDKEDKEEKVKKVVWKFKVEELDSVLKPSENVLEFDLNGNSDQTLGKYKLTLKPVSHTFDKTELSGRAFTSEPEMRLKGFSGDVSEVSFDKVVLCSGFTTFLKDDKVDFVSLWHSGDFHHYSTKGELLSKGPFPFAAGDPSKSPDKLDLPKGKDLEPTKPPVIPPVPKEPEPTTPKEPEPTTPKEPEPTTPKKEEEKEKDEKKPYEKFIRLEDIVDGDAVIDLSLYTFATQEKPYEYEVNKVTVKISLANEVGQFKSFVYERKDGKIFKPVLSFDGTYVKLPDSSVKQLRSFLNERGEPLVVTYLDSDRNRKSWAHKGKNEWELRFEILTEGLLEHFAAFLDGSTILDVSVKSGSYDGGLYTVQVSETTHVERKYQDFRSFTHKFYDVSGTGTNVKSKVYKYKLRSLELVGLSLKPEVDRVVVYFSKFDEELVKPFMITLFVELAELNYVYTIDNTYSLETDNEKILPKLELFASRFTHFASIDPTKRETYSPSIFESSIYLYSKVVVECQNHNPSKQFVKCVHTLESQSQRVPFTVSSVRKFFLSPPDTKVTSVEVFHVRSDKPGLLLRFISSSEPVTYLLKDGQYNRSSFDDKELTEMLRFASYTEANYINVDFYNYSAYCYNGTFHEPKHPSKTVIVKSENHKLLQHVMKVEHTLEKKSGVKDLFKVFETNGFLADLPDEKFKSVDVYFSFRVANHALMVVFFSETSHFVYTWNGRQYVHEKNLKLYNLATRLKTLLYKVFEVLYLDLTPTGQFSIKYVDSENKVEDVKVEVKDLGDFADPISGSTDSTIKKNLYTLPKCTEIRLIDGSFYALKSSESHFFTALVFHWTHNSVKKPVFLTISTDKKIVYLRLTKSVKKWEEYHHGYEIMKFLPEAIRAASS